MTSNLNLGSKIPISELSGDISEASGVSGFLDDDLTKLSQTGKEAVFNGITIDFSSGVRISNNGAMPFDGWAKVTVSSWGEGGVLNGADGYINNVQVVTVVTGTNGSGNNASVFVPVKQGDVFTATFQGINKSAGCTLYPYKNQQEEA